ncbi:MAG: magnesium transporter [Campylobacterota bacterium]|nr:magnesium transporter [Campylobacterota bacterium]
MKRNDPLLHVETIKKEIKNRDALKLKKLILKLEQADLSELLDSLTREESVYIYKLISPALQPLVFGDICNSHQNYIVRSLSSSEVTLLLSTMPVDERNLFISKLPRTKRKLVLENMSESELDEWQRYGEEEIGHWVTHEFFCALPNWSVKHTIDELKKFETAHSPVYKVYIVNNNNQLIDSLSLNTIVVNSDETELKDIMDFQTASLNDRDSLEYVFDRFQTRDAISMPVVNDENILVGVIFADDIMHLQQDKMTDEIHKMGGLDSSDTPYMQSSIMDQLKKRGGWLAVLFLGEMLTATAMGHFEDTLDQAVVLALFLPLILSSGGNSGSQSSTLIIRALALKEFELSDWPIIFRRELITGAILGLFLGVVGVIRIVFWETMGWSDYTEHGKFSSIDVGLAVTVGIVGIVAWGNLVGSLLPIAIKKLKLDPATISAPFLATFVDVTGLILYFSVAKMLLNI